ncbi:CaiB/BaiF CoA transferase family protein [Nocardia sp. NPDC050630]|uniref:CaiB/BaiF CoA transferase family protein n=1 Tax=Nocardia sp. NPDC050630 TaxID=3364321 RepID=UPI0037B1B25A
MRQDLLGIRVVAVEQAVAAPLCSRHLADLGADVVKIERPPAGDFARQYDSAVLGWSSHFVWLNRGKRSFVLDLKSDSGVAAFEQLVTSADVLVSNLAPGALERIVPDSRLESLNPRLVRCYISGYGGTGPYSDRKAYDALVQGEAGTILATGTVDQPAKPGVSLADVGGGVYALASILAALLERQRTGVGKRVEVALFDVLLEWMSPLLLAEQYDGAAPPPAGLGHASIAPYGPFRCRDGVDIMIAVQNDGQWQRLCGGALDAAHLLTDENATNAQRVARRAVIDAAVQTAIAFWTATELTERLQRADVPFGRLNTLRDVLAHPQAEANGRWSMARLPNGRQVVVTTSPLETGGAEEVERSIPSLGDVGGDEAGEMGSVVVDIEGIWNG